MSTSKSSSSVSSKKTVEDKYKKLSQREHVLHRSGMYIGSIKKQTEEIWCFKENKMVKCMVEYSPGFMKIFDEVLTNALDHSIRDSTLTTIKVGILNFCLGAVRSLLLRLVDWGFDLYMKQSLSYDDSNLQVNYTVITEGQGNRTRICTGQEIFGVYGVVF